MAGHDKLTPQGVQFFKQIKELTELEVRVGYQRGKVISKISSAVKVAKKTKRGKKLKSFSDTLKEAELCDIALYNELGVPSKNIPSRPFLAQSVDNNADKINEKCKEYVNIIAQGGSAKDVFQKVGAMHVGLVQLTIDNGDFVENAPATRARKNSEKPLIDTGRLRQNVTFITCKKGEYD